MPLYEYQCQNCGYELEIIHKVSEKITEICPSCHFKLKKKPSLTSFQLKGGGWYKDSYNKKSEKPASAPVSSNKNQNKPVANKTSTAKKKNAKA